MHIPPSARRAPMQTSDRVMPVVITLNHQTNTVAEHKVAPQTPASAARASPDLPHDSPARSRQIQTWIFATLARRKGTAVFLAGVICAGGVLMALSGGPSATDVATNPTVVASATHAPRSVPAPTIAAEDVSVAQTQVLSPSAITDPRAFAIARALSGDLDGESSTWTNATANILSRNGDVVLVEIRCEDTTGLKKRLSVLLVRNETAWVVREIYPSEESEGLLG